MVERYTRKKIHYFYNVLNKADSDKMIKCIGFLFWCLQQKLQILQKQNVKGGDNHIC